MGIDPFEDKDFLYIARDGLKAALPDPWKACRLRDDEICYYNPITGEYKAVHPLDDYYRNLFEQEKKARKKKKQNTSGPSNFKSKFAQKLNMGSVIPPVMTGNKALPNIGQKIDAIPPITKNNELKNKSMSFDASFSANNSFMSNNNQAGGAGLNQLSSVNDNNFIKSIDENPSPIMFKKTKNIISEVQLDGSFDQEIFGSVASKATKTGNMDNDHEQKIENEIEEKFLNFEKLKQKEIENLKISLNKELIKGENEENNNLKNDLNSLKNHLSENVQASRIGFVREKDTIRKSLMEEFETKYQHDSEKLEEEHCSTLKDLEAKENLNIDQELQNYESKTKSDRESQKFVKKFTF